MEIASFWQMAAFSSKIQKSRLNLKLNFTTSKWSPYLYEPFYCLVMVTVWLWSYFYTFLPCNQQYCCLIFLSLYLTHFSTLCHVWYPWNNGKSGAKLDLTSSTTTGLQIHKFDHTRTANPCDWLLCRRAALLLVSYPHSLVYLHLPVVEGLIFCISATPHLGTSFPLFHELGSCKEAIR